MTEIKLLDVRYVGRCKKRENGSSTAYGWVNKAWSVAFTQTALYQWFGVPTTPGEAATLYGVLGIAKSVTDDEIKKAFRRAAKQSHPDLSREPDARKQFEAIKHAYDVLSSKRARYDAGLALEATLGDKSTATQEDEYGYRSPLRCGWILGQGAYNGRKKFVVEKILGWEDIVNASGKTLVSSWIYGNDEPTEVWG